MVILVTMTTMTLADAKARFSEVVGRVHDHHERITITVHGKPTAVILSVYDLESIMETLAVLGDPEAMAQLRAAEDEPTVPMEDVERELRDKRTPPGRTDAA